jgi:hypothetical protein
LAVINMYKIKTYSTQSITWCSRSLPSSTAGGIPQQQQQQQQQPVNNNTNNTASSVTAAAAAAAAKRSGSTCSSSSTLSSAAAGVPALLAQRFFTTLPPSGTPLDAQFQCLQAAGQMVGAHWHHFTAQATVGNDKVIAAYRTKCLFRYIKADLPVSKSSN